MDVNFKGVWYGCRVFGKRLLEQGTPAAIYNTGSENSLFVAIEGSAAYVAAKHAVHGLTEALRGEMPDYVTVGMITPGIVGSELIPEPVRGRGRSPDEFAAIAVKQIQADEFYVVSCSYNQVHIDKRYRDVSKAYASYAPRQEGDERYDVGVLMSQISSQD
jgi:NAD(P)-dependent dehydrogenase (short-subunit alcohol dehydrogenase family)